MTMPSRDPELNAELGKNAENLTQLDNVCDHFVAAWRDGRKPRIEDYLTKVPAPHRVALLGELLHEERAFRQTIGETVTANDYLTRFPDDREMIEKVFAEVVSATPDDSICSTAVSAMPQLASQSRDPVQLSDRLGSTIDDTVEHIPSGTDHVSQFRDLLTRFESAWKVGQVPSIEEFLSQSDWHKESLLLELIHVDIAHRLERGKRPRARDYFLRFPQLRANEAAATELIVAEFQLWRRHGLHRDISEIQDSYKEFADALSVVLRLPQQEHRRRWPVRVQCGKCKREMAVLDDDAQRVMKCPQCQEHLRCDNGETRSWTGEALPLVGRFQLLAEVGRGGFGTVYRALDTELGRIVAIKIPKEGAFSHRNDAELFVREASHAAQLDHQGIVRIFDVSRTNDFPYIVSEFVDGTPLSTAIQKGKPTPTDAAEMILRIADALHHAHEQRVIHRDLKPSNIMIDIHGTPRIMDFGLAIKEVLDQAMPLDGSILGTPAYMSPEQAKGASQSVDRRADIYSLGVIFFELLSGERPFRGTGSKLLAQVIHDDAPKLRELDDRIPRDLETIVAKCLEKIPSKRFATASELRDDIQRHLRNEVILSRPIGSWERALRWCQRNALLVRSSVAVLVTLLTSLAIVSWSWHKESIARKTASELALSNRELYEAEATARQTAETARRHALERLRDARSATDLWLTVFPLQLEGLVGGPEVIVNLLDRAAQDYERFAQQNSDDPELELERARCWFRAGAARQRMAMNDTALTAFQNARTIFSKKMSNEALAAEARSDLAKTLQQIGLVHLELDEPEKAEEAYLDSIREATGSLATKGSAITARKTLADSLFNLAVLQFRIGKSSLASSNIINSVTEYQSLIRSVPGDQAIRLGWVNALSLQSQLANEDGQSATARQLLTLIRRELDDIVAKAPDDFEARSMRAEKSIAAANVYRTLGRFDDELKCYESAVSDFDHLIELRFATPRVIEQRGLALSDQGNLLHHLGRMREAVSPLEHAIASLAHLAELHGLPSHYLGLASARSMLGEVYRELNETSSSIQVLRSAVSILSQLHEQAPTIGEYRERLAVARAQLGQSLVMANDPDAGIKELQAAIEEFEQIRNNESTRTALTDELGGALWALADLQRREGTGDFQATYRRVYQLWSQLDEEIDSIDSLNQFAWFLVLRGKEVAGSNDLLARIIERIGQHDSGQNPLYQLTVGAAKYRMGESDQAIDVLNRLLSSAPDMGSANYFLAMAHASKGDHEEARSILAMARNWRSESRPGSHRLRDLEEEAERIVAGRPTEKP